MNYVDFDITKMKATPDASSQVYRIKDLLVQAGGGGAYFEFKNGDVTF